MLEVSVGIPAYNEEANIDLLLTSLFSQRLKRVKIRDVIVVAGGTDRTKEIVQKWQKKEQILKLIVEKKRQGKAKADNLFFQKAKSEILVLLCADTVLEPDCLENLILPFSDLKVGVAAAKMIPLNSKDNLAGFFGHLWWRLFDRIAKKNFRAGEMMAIRNLKILVPLKIGCDEVYLTDEVLAKGFKAVYNSTAICHNLCPKNLRDIIKLRRRHNCHHLQFAKFGPKVYYPKTMDSWYVFKIFLKEVKWSYPREAFFAVLSASLEAFCRLLSVYDYWRGERYQVWPRGLSTKKLTGEKNFVIGQGRLLYDKNK